jgi:hypothetical protein
MALGRSKHIHWALMFGIALSIVLCLAYSLYVDLSGTMLLSSDMNVEDPEGEDVSTCQNEFKVSVPTASSNLLLFGTHFCRGSSLVSSSLTSYTHVTPLLRC